MSGRADRSTNPLVVVAIGGNALLERGQRLDHDSQVANVRRGARAVADLARVADVAIVHGNGPQVGLLAIESATGPAPMPLDVLDAESQGQIGYLLSIELGNLLTTRPIATLLTQVEVDAGDDAFGNPAKPIGPTYDEVRARALALERGWIVKPDTGGWRRVVASPDPVAVVEIEVIRTLVDAGVLVICGGGGGIPVARSGDGTRVGIEAVIDKDRTAALIARSLGAAKLVLLTDVESVFDGFGSDDQRPILDATVGELRDREFPSGSMGPKVDAACWFASETGRPAAIGTLANALAVCRGSAGTQIWP